MSDLTPVTDSPPGLPRVVIVGAGFGGLWAARALADSPVQVTLLDRFNHHTFFPLLYQVGAAELEPFAIARPVRALIRRQRNISFLMADISAIETGRRQVVSEQGIHGYDFLIVSPGSEPHDFGIPGVRDHAYPLRTLEDGVALRNQVLSRFEAATRLTGPSRRRRALRFVIVGGGPTGVEFAGALAELIHGPLARDYPSLEEDTSIVLLEAAPRLLGSFPDKLGRYAERRLVRKGVDVRRGASVQAAWPDAVQLASGEEIASETIVWTAGVRAPGLIERSGLPTDRTGRVRVLSTLQCPGHPEVFVVGDAASIVPPGEDEPLPQLAQVAMQSGERAAANIERILEDLAPEVFAYRDRGVMAVIGRNAAAAHVAGRSFTGYVAWLLWLGIHLFALIGFRNRLAVLLNWSWDYLFFERVARILLPFRRRDPAWPA